MYIHRRWSRCHTLQKTWWHQVGTESGTHSEPTAPEQETRLLLSVAYNISKNLNISKNWSQHPCVEQLIYLPLLVADWCLPRDISQREGTEDGCSGRQSHDALCCPELLPAHKRASRYMQVKSNLQKYIFRNEILGHSSMQSSFFRFNTKPTIQHRGTTDVTQETFIL